MKRIFNWPSGAGGDFLLTLLYILKKNNPYNYGFDPVLNLWGPGNDVDQPKRLRTFGVNDTAEKLTYISKLSDNEILLMHDMFIINIFNITLSEDTKMVSIYPNSKLIEVYLSSLYNIKCRDSIEISEQNFVNETAWIHGATNYLYSDIFFDQKDDILYKFFSDMGHDMNKEECIQIKETIRLYNKLNETILFSNIPIGSRNWNTAGVISTDSIESLVEQLNLALKIYNEEERNYWQYF